MTNPVSTSEGYSKTEHWLADNIKVHRRPPSVTVLLVILIRQTAGWQRDEVTLGIKQLAEMCGLSAQGTRNAITYALKYGLIKREFAGNDGHTYRVLGGSTECSPLGDQLSVGGSTECARGLHSVDPYKDKKETLPTGEQTPAVTAPSAPEPKRQPQPDRPVRTNPLPVALTPPPLATATPTPAAAGQVPAEIEQPRLVDADIADPVDVYKAVCKIKKPNEVQRKKIREVVTGYVDEWQGVCERWMLNGWYAGKVENLLDAYAKAVIERRKVDARAAETRRQEAERAKLAHGRPATDEEVRAIFARFHAWKEPTASSAAA
jgi:hypothetical protein